MIELFGEIYYIDFEILDKFLISNPNLKSGVVTETQTTILMDSDGKTLNTTVVTDETIKPSEINGVRFEIIRALIDDISNSNIEDGDTLKDMTAGVKLAFNTLTAYQILKPIEE